MPIENGVNWQPVDPQSRGRHASFSSAVAASLADLLTEKDDFFDQVVDNWPRLFPGLPARPGRVQDGCIYLYVAKATTSFALRSKLPFIRRQLQTLPGAPKTINLRVEIHAS